MSVYSGGPRRNWLSQTDRRSPVPGRTVQASSNPSPSQSGSPSQSSGMPFALQSVDPPLAMSSSSGIWFRLQSGSQSSGMPSPSTSNPVAHQGWSQPRARSDQSPSHPWQREPAAVAPERSDGSAGSSPMITNPWRASESVSNPSRHPSTPSTQMPTKNDVPSPPTSMPSEKITRPPPSASTTAEADCSRTASAGSPSPFGSLQSPPPIEVPAGTSSPS